MPSRACQQARLSTTVPSVSLTSFLVAQGGLWLLHAGAAVVVERAELDALQLSAAELAAVVEGKIHSAALDALQLSAAGIAVAAVVERQIHSAALDALQLYVAGIAVAAVVERIHAAALDALQRSAAGVAVADVSRLLQDRIRVWAMSLPVSAYEQDPSRRRSGLHPTALLVFS